MRRRLRSRLSFSICAVSTFGVLACGTTDDSATSSTGDVAKDDVVGDVTLDMTGDVAEYVANDTESDDAADTPSDTGTPVADAFRVVHIDASQGIAAQLAVHACAGLYNRQLGGSVVVETDPDVPMAAIDGAITNDRIWLESLALEAKETVEAPAFLEECVAEFGGCVRYSYSTQREILPSILTVAAAKGVPPLADESPLRCEKPVVDAVEVFAGKDTQLLATEYVYQNYLSETTGLAMLNPGYNRTPTDLANPPLTDEMQVALIDMVFARRLFVVFMIGGCVDGDPEKALLSKIVNESGWATPIGVYGYNDSWLVGGYLYEAQTRCLDSANMGAIPSRTTNLSFFDTRSPAIEDASDLPAIAPEQVDYDPTKTYVAFVIGDGDNIRYIMSTRKEWLEQRIATCKGAEPKCPPLTWTISPHLPDLAPDVLRWYYETAASTGADYFMLPPSGYQYAYPGAMAKSVQPRFASETERVGKLLGTRSVIHWEWFEDWGASVANYIPRYARKDGQIRGVFPMNVPYLIEAFPSWPAEKEYEIIKGEDGGRVVLFRSHSWRGVNDSDAFHPNPQAMADRLAALPPGTVTWVYMTSDGGLSLENSYGALTALLPKHVQLVSTDAAAALALEASGE
jgi:hypothetical protein